MFQTEIAHINEEELYGGKIYEKGKYFGLT